MLWTDPIFLWVCEFKKKGKKKRCLVFPENQRFRHKDLSRVSNGMQLWVFSDFLWPSTAISKILLSSQRIGTENEQQAILHTITGKLYLDWGNFQKEADTFNAHSYFQLSQLNMSPLCCFCGGLFLLFMLYVHHLYNRDLSWLTQSECVFTLHCTQYSQQDGTFNKRRLRSTEVWN